MLQAHFVATGSQEGDPGETFGIHDLKFPHAVRGVGGIGAGHGLKTTRALAYEHGFPDLVVVAPAADQKQRDVVRTRVNNDEPYVVGLDKRRHSVTG